MTVTRQAKTNMKKLTAISLALAFLVAPPPIVPRAQAQLAPAMLVTVCLLGGVGVIIYVFEKNRATHMGYVALECSHFDGNWTRPVHGTNYLLIPPSLTLALPAFEAVMTDDTALYRCVEIPAPTNGWTPQNNIVLKNGAVLIMR